MKDKTITMRVTADVFSKFKKISDVSRLSQSDVFQTFVNSTELIPDRRDFITQCTSGGGFNNDDDETKTGNDKNRFVTDVT